MHWASGLRHPIGASRATMRELTGEIASDGASTLLNGVDDLISAPRNRNRRITMARLVTLVLLCTAFFLSLLPAAPLTAQRLPQQIATPVPQELLRRAVNLVAETRGSERAPGWARAAVNPNAQPLYRPDLNEPAYYEFSVEIELTGTTVRPAGFVILSTDTHDFPVAHWSDQGEAPSRLLKQRATIPGKPAPQELKFYKLDVLAYAAEDQRGTLVAELGDMPAKVTGLTPELLASDALVESEAIPTIDGDDSNAAAMTYTTEITGNVTSPLTISAWADWAEMKREYAAVYGPWLAELKANASGDWEVAEILQRHGDVLAPGDSYPLAMLTDGADVRLEGPGAVHVTGTPEGQGTLAPIVRIDVHSAVSGEFLPLAVHLSYPDGVSEQVNFIIGERIAPAQTRIYLPLLGNGGAPSGSAVTAEPSTTTSAAFALEEADTEATLSASYGSWSNWTTFWAGTHNDQRLYRQIQIGEAPNTSSCVSGCGATAWAMLFGWVDFRASHSGSMWVNRWGVYRANGGTGSNAVAPRNIDNGVRNMQWEIRNDIDTFCFQGSGATSPWNMIEVTNYLSGRSALRVTDKYSVIGRKRDDLRDFASKTINEQRTPVIIGTGWLAHYPLAYGYQRRERWVYRTVLSDYKQYQREFYVNQGWSGNSNGWIPAQTWYAGTVRP